MGLNPDDFKLDAVVSTLCGGDLEHPPDAFQLGFSFWAGDKQVRQGILLKMGKTPQEMAAALRRGAEWFEWFGSEEYLQTHPETAKELGLIGDEE